MGPEFERVPFVWKRLPAPLRSVDAAVDDTHTVADPKLALSDLRNTRQRAAGIEAYDDPMLAIFAVVPFPRLTTPPADSRAIAGGLVGPARCCGDRLQYRRASVRNAAEPRIARLRASSSPTSARTERSRQHRRDDQRPIITPVRKLPHCRSTVARRCDRDEIAVSSSWRNFRFPRANGRSAHARFACQTTPDTAGAAPRQRAALPRLPSAG